MLCTRSAAALTGTALLALAACAGGGSGPRGPASARARPPLDWRTLVGCYRLAGTRVALDSLPPKFVFEHPVPAAHKAWRYPRPSIDMFWRVLPGDTVEMVSGDGLYGSVYRLAPRGGSLVGYVTGWSDLPGRIRPERRVAVRESCSPDGSGDEPPPNPDLLQARLIGAIASVVADSLVPTRADGERVHLRLAERYSYAAAVDSLLLLGGRVDDARDAVHGVWVRPGEVDVSRDSARAAASLIICREGAGTNYSARRDLFRFVRVGSGWKLLGVTRGSTTHGTCGATLRR